MASLDDLGDLDELDPYQILGLDPSAAPDKVKSAYYKAALRHHPDKVAADQKSAAHAKFQSIAFSYAVLSDPVRRARYDATGSTAESIHEDNDDFSWTDYFAERFRDAVSIGTIGAFAAVYRGSDEERTDLLAAYSTHEGNMDAIFETVMLSRPVEDEERFRVVIDTAIRAGEAESFTAYTHESRRGREGRAKRAREEAAEAEKLAEGHGARGRAKSSKSGKGAKGGGGGGEDDLAALIRQNHKKRGEEFLDKLAAKYGAKPGKGRRKRGPEEETEVGGEEEGPPEEAFRATAERSRKRKAGGARKEPEEEPSEDGFQAGAGRLRKRKTVARKEGKEEREGEEEEEEKEVPTARVTRSRKRAREA